MSKLLGYDFVVDYKKGSKNRVADALSRKEDEISLALISIPSVEWLVEIKQGYDKDPDLQELVTRYQAGQLNQHDSMREKAYCLIRAGCT